MEWEVLMQKYYVRMTFLDEMGISDISPDDAYQQ